MKQENTLFTRTSFIVITILILIAAARPEDRGMQALVRIDVRRADDLALVRATALPVYARLWDSTGQEYLLALADPARQKALRGQGLTLRVLDANSTGASYYLLFARQPETFTQASNIVTLLDVDGRQAIARASAEQAEQLPALRIELKRLAPIPFPAADRIAALPEAITPDPIIEQMINQVSSTTVHDYNGGLSGEWPVTIGGELYDINTRHTNQAVPIEKATQFVYEHFDALGLPVQYDYYNPPYYGIKRNVVAEQAGLSQPDRIFIIVAHLDDMPSGAVAPGADDNASGSTGVLIAADILSQYDFDCTLRYLLVTGEEQGLYGSYYYAQDVYNAGDDIEGVLNLDMIAYDSDASPIIELHTRPSNAGDLAIANLFADVVSAYALDLTPQIVQDGNGQSDHASFWDFGYSAILGIEDFQDFTPYYHTTNDKLNTLNIPYFTEFVKASIGTFAHMGCLLPPTGHLEGVVSDATTGNPISGATVRASLSPTQYWSAATLTDGSYGLDLVPGTYTVTAQAAGYMLTTIPGISIGENQTTTLNLTLAVTPTYTVTGYVRDAYSGNPLSATVSVVGDAAHTAQTDPASGFYTLPLLAGAYTLQAEADHYCPRQQPVDLSANRQVDFDLQPICLLYLPVVSKDSP